MTGAVIALAALVVGSLWSSTLGRVLSSPSASGWAQAFGSTLAVLVAIAVPMMQRSHEQKAERESRLSVVTTAAPHTGGFDVQVVYAPQSRNARLFARITAIEPARAALLPMVEGRAERAYRPEFTDLHATPVGTPLLIDLLPSEMVATGLIRGWLHCNTYEDGPCPRARLRLEVLQGSEPKPLVTRTVEVSPIDAPSAAPLGR